MLSNKDFSFLNVALYLAEKSAEKKKHGAIVVKSGRVVGMGFNKYRNNPEVIPEELIKKHCSRHAEEVAIREAGDNAKGAVLYVARINRQGIKRYSKPCSMCSKLIKKSGIKRVVYTTEES